MAISACDAFKIGFLSRCVEDRLSPEQMLDTVKRADDLLEKTAVLGGLSHLAGKGVDLGKGVAQSTLGIGLPLALAVPPILGGMAGYGLARATDLDPTDIEQIKQQELVDAYKREADKLKRQKQIREYAAAAAKSGRVFL